MRADYLALEHLEYFGYASGRLARGVASILNDSATFVGDQGDDLVSKSVLFLKR